MANTQYFSSPWNSASGPLLLSTYLPRNSCMSCQPQPPSHSQGTTEFLLEALASLPPSFAERFRVSALTTLSFTFLITRRNSGTDAQGLVQDGDSGHLC